MKKIDPKEQVQVKKIQRRVVDNLINEQVAFLKTMGYELPPEAFWSLRQWYENKDEVADLRTAHVGWDLTDFGSGKFKKVGLLLYTLSNGILGSDGKPIDQLYANKLLIVQEDQVTPTHHHYKKMEDIINAGTKRKSGDLLVELHNVGEGELLDTTSPVIVRRDGRARAYSAGTVIALEPGERVRLETHHYHKFWARNGTALVLEVSGVNDDNVDNGFLDNILKPGSIGRFPTIKEGISPPKYLLCNELPGTQRFDQLVETYFK